MAENTPELELFEHLEDLVFIHDLQGSICYVNRYVQKFLGYSPDDLFNKNILDFLPTRYQEKYFNYLQSLKSKKYVTGVVEVFTQKGRERLLEFRNVVCYQNGKPNKVVGVGRDITQRERMEKALTEALGRFESIIEHTPLVAVQGFDINGCIYHWNPVSEKLYGMSMKEVLEKPFHKLFLKGSDEKRFLNDLKRVFSGLPVENREFAIVTANGEKRWVYSSMFPVFEGGCCLEAIRMEIDITERKKVEERLEYLSTHDPLTGIYNRAFFEEEMRRLENPRFRPVSIIVCDVDDLKVINDTFGHGKGDKLLKAVADTIKMPFRSSDMVARIGGDEFVILLPLTSEAVAREACRRIKDSIENYNRNNPGELPLSVTLGVSTNTDPNIPLIETFKEADSDMYNNKINTTDSKSIVVYSMLDNVHEKLSIPPGYGCNIQEMAVAMAREAGLSRKDIAAVAVLALVHDIGKVVIPDNIIYKRGMLLPQEREVMQKHPIIGYHIALSSSKIELVANYILAHHEWWNGEGYPYGLKAYEIPAPCRIIAVVEAYNAMISERPYRRAFSHEEAISEIKRCSGTQFDPQMVNYFLKLFA